jgi:hypothetical protein
VGEQRDDGIDVCAFPGVDKAADDLAQPLVSEFAKRGLLASRRESLVGGLVRALERGVDRCGCHLERVGDLSCREPEHVAEDQDGALLGGDVLQGGDER